MKRLAMVALVLAASSISAAFAQTTVSTGIAAPVGITSPLGIGPGAPVAATGIPLGATELATPGVSQSTATLGSMATAATTATACSATPGSVPTASLGLGGSTTGNMMSGGSPATGAINGTSAPTPIFDGSGIAGTASGTCASTIASSSPTASASSPTMASRSTVGRVGIPMGSTELAAGGLSPLPDITMQSQAAAVTTATSMTPCPTNGASSATGTSMASSGC